MKRRKTKDWYSLDRIMSHDTVYKIIIGEKGNGKTYSVKKYLLEDFKKFGRKFLVLRQTHNCITRKKAGKFFKDMKNLITDMFDGEIIYKTESGFTLINGNGAEHIGYITSIQDYIIEKGIPFNEYDNIIFDEFINPRYLTDEISQFVEMISTICRERKGVKIFMCGNTISKYCPYFELFGYNPAKLKQGYIHDVFHKNGVSASLEYCKTRVNSTTNTKYNSYTGFDNSDVVDMVLYGDWQTKRCETSQIDGFSWNSNRILVPCYFTALKEVFEMSIVKTRYPITFVRKINTQGGKVNSQIKYNLSADKSLFLTNSKGIVPYFGKISSFMDEITIEYLKTVQECIKTKRIVFDNELTGTEFLKNFVDM